MNLFFIYDLNHCKADEDDPKEAIIYFYPTQNAESEWYLLCCQLVGMAKFLRNTFSTPHVIGLDQGKFVLLWSGKYLLALGDDSDVECSVLQNQMLFLCGIFCFYHGSISNVLKLCKGNREDFLSKLELAWSRYITLSSCFGNMFQFSISALTQCRSSKKVIAKATRLLHICQLSSSVIAGAVFHNSKAIESQLTSQMTNYLSLMSNSNASAPVSNVCSVPHDLPPDVQLKYVYLSAKTISKILKYNHTSVGSCIRIKSSTKTLSNNRSLVPRPDQLSSGSEADVDSGNCSENFPTVPFEKGSRFAVKKSSILSWSKMKFIRRSSIVFCCTGHWRLWRRKLLLGRNQNCLSKSTPEEDIETEDSGVAEYKHDLNLTRIHDTKFQSNHVLCHHHVTLKASSFISNSSEKHSNFKNSSDLEFDCSLCSDRNQSINLLSIKHWNSEQDLTCSRISKNFTYTASKELSHAVIPEKQKKPFKRSKVQVLKCLGSESSHRTRHSLYRNRTSMPKQNSDFKKSVEQPIEIEHNDLQRFVLYVQRYGSSTLLLLLKKGYDENILSYLWNCGFSILRDIEYSSEKISLESVFDVDPNFYMLLYNSTKKVLKEYPSNQSDSVINKQARSSAQAIHADFEKEHNLRELHLLSTFYSIDALHKDPYVTFYIQQECNSRKMDTLLNLSRRAKRRREKIFKI